jgi:hypothetical protein
MTLALKQSSSNAETVERLLRGAVDLHCHSGPSVMPRDFDHITAAEEAEAAGFSAILFKDHYYSVAPVVKLLEGRLDLRVRMLSGIALNNAVGGLNRFAVDHAIQLGARLVWMPTFSSANHLAHHKADVDFDKKFPTPLMKMLAPVPLGVLDANGALLDEVKIILDLIAEHDIVLSAGHLHISEIWPLFEEARARGVQRYLVNHPNYIVDATLADVSALANMGAFLEHSMCMYVEGSKFKFYEPELLRTLIEAGTVERTILGSDLGQSGNPRPVEGFRMVIQMCLDLGYDETAIRKMVGGNAKVLLGLEETT